MVDSLVSNLGELRLDDPQSIIQATIDRGNALQAEIQQYVSAVTEHQKHDWVPHRVNCRTLTSDLETELSALAKLKKSNPSPAQVQATNLLYFESIWAACKRSSGLVDFRRFFYWKQRKYGNHLSGKFAGQHKTQNRNKFTNRPGEKMNGATLVDIVAQSGREWVRVSTATQKRLIHDLAKLGWQNDSDSEDDDNDMPDASKNTREDGDNDDDEDEVFLVKNARELIRAARANPMRGRPPTVRFVLSRIESGKIKEVDAVLEKMRATGVIVQCANDLPETPSLDSVLSSLLVYPSDTSETLNIDCTILMAMISDVSHKECPILDRYPAQIRMQIEEEREEKLLPQHLYPAIGSHPMVCTQDAADQMNHIVETLAADEEKARADILLGQNDRQNVAPDVLLKQWQELSDHTIPNGFQLPIRVVPCNVEDMIKTLPAVATKLAPELGPSNAAIFFYGWANHLTTLSANRTRARQIERRLQEVGLDDGEVPPHIWCCGGPRSLVAKSRGPGRKKHEFKEI
ncbi:hypothetical protein P280DRAFT_440168 [Massarina eburnea CBS 473.64]|uniref:DUF1308 domain-containing protein n=1 Tax=Massarina eburnea CBS 473.64 TaxID=1395130 RepID=A0A6A6SIR2_9PLEO|nr:hypothetical protein P280DRAFT_440168 [Massarina eburnea CBS 473.64]